MGFWSNLFNEDLAEKRFSITGDFANQLELEYGYKKTRKEYKDFVTPEISVKKEPFNSHDKDAIAVYAYNLKLGYLSKEKQRTYNNVKNKRKETVRFYYDKKEDFYTAFLIVSYAK